MPKQEGPEFWNIQRIEHIRMLARFGEPVTVWDRAKHFSRRLLDRLRFKAELEKPSPAIRKPRDVDTSTEMAYGRIEMTSPLYLGDMSFGALSGVPNIALARAADLTGIVTGTGEGGLHPEVRKCKRITVQWASARFGVDIDVLNTGLGIVIKIGQGAKPGIGGHLPGVKVTKPISETRRIPIGIDAISPAPHHDIYSIEDLGQRIHALKEATGKPVFVKVGVTNYIAYIASGVARMGADGIIMDGHGAGTGASPKVIRNNVGLPIEIAVPVVDMILRREGLREGFTVVAAGRVSSAEDSAKLIALGADVVSLGTAPLIAMGCVMVHKCHLGFCPAVITNKIEENPVKLLSLETATRWVANMVRGWTAEMQLMMEEIGVSSVKELRGRKDLLTGFGVDSEELSLIGVEAV
ncbi:MAG: FMN-binding glutamate synthase family protein [Candidatus Caldarchaeum sp.]